MNLVKKQGRQRVYSRDLSLNFKKVAEVCNTEAYQAFVFEIDIDDIVLTAPGREQTLNPGKEQMRFAGASGANQNTTRVFADRYGPSKHRFWGNQAAVVYQYLTKNFERNHGQKRSID